MKINPFKSKSNTTPSRTQALVHQMAGLIGRTTSDLPKRNGHGSTAYSQPGDKPGNTLLQPQDGAAVDIAAKPPANMLMESEDARLTGLTRSLGRRLLGLNLSPTLRRSPAIAAPPKAQNISPRRAALPSQAHAA